MDGRNGLSNYSSTWDLTLHKQRKTLLIIIQVMSYVLLEDGPVILTLKEINGKREKSNSNRYG